MESKKTLQVKAVVIRPLTVNGKEYEIGDAFQNKVFEDTFNGIKECLQVYEANEIVADESAKEKPASEPEKKKDETPVEVEKFFSEEKPADEEITKKKPVKAQVKK